MEDIWLNANTLGWIANFFYVTGSIFFIVKKPVQYIMCGVIANSLYVRIGVIQNLESLIYLEIYFIVTGIISFFVWRHKKCQCTCMCATNVENQ